MQFSVGRAMESSVAKRSLMLMLAQDLYIDHVSTIICTFIVTGDVRKRLYHSGSIKLLLYKLSNLFSI